MRQVYHPLLVLTFVSFLLLAACGETVVETAPTATPTPEAPAGVVTARDAVHAFLIDAAIITVPPDGVPWHAQQGPAPSGFSVYRFDAEGCTMTVSFDSLVEEPSYYVTVSNQPIGFCWQAEVNRFGRLTETGEAAVMMPELVQAAADYCLGQGYEYAVEEQPDGSECGMCIFTPDDACKAWAFYQGFCGPAAADDES